MRGKTACREPRRDAARAARWMLLCLLCSARFSAEDRAARPEANPSAEDLVRQATANELKAQREDRRRWRFRLEWQRANAQPDTYQVIQTTDGDLKRPVLLGGRPLTAEQKQQSDKQIEQLVRDPGPLRRDRARQTADAARILRLLTILPDASNFTYGERRGDLVQLNFSPKPDFHPPSHEAEVFHAVAGSLWVELSKSRIEEMSGRLIHDVKFGGGILGHVNQGGTFEVKQGEVAPGSWQLTEVKIEMQGKALFFKTIQVRQNYARSDFKPVPENLSVAEAAKMIEKQGLEDEAGPSSKPPARLRARDPVPANSNVIGEPAWAFWAGRASK